MYSHNLRVLTMISRSSKIKGVTLVVILHPFGEIFCTININEKAISV